MPALGGAVVAMGDAAVVAALMLGANALEVFWGWALTALAYCLFAFHIDGWIRTGFVRLLAVFCSGFRVDPSQ